METEQINESKKKYSHIVINTKTMYTKFSIWTYNEKEEKWYGICPECKGEKAKYTPEQRIKLGIKPCPLCSTLHPSEIGKYEMKGKED